MSIRFEYQNTGGANNGTQSIYGAKFTYQSFTPSVAHLISSVKIMTWVVSGGQTLHADIYAADGNHKPTGSALATGSVSTTGWPTSWATQAWKEIVIDTPCALTAETEYCIVLRAPDAGVGTAIYWIQTSTSLYSGGLVGNSSDSGSTWTVASTMDALFEEYGDPLYPIAVFTASPVKGVEDLSVTFTNASYGGIAPLSYLWDFGDGSSNSTEENPVHIYTTPGRYTVSLMVVDSEESEDTETKTDYIWVQPSEIFSALATEEDKTPIATEAWTDVDMSGIISIDATGVLVHIINTGLSEQTWGIRENGSSDNITGKIAAGAQAWGMVGVDNTLKFESYISSLDVKVYVYAYSMYGVEFIAAVQKSLSSGWTDIACAANSNSETAGLIFIVKNTSADTIREYGIRKNGSNEAFNLGSAGGVDLAPGQLHFVTIGCDTAQKCEFQTTNTTDVKLYLIGYIFDTAEFNSNAVDVSLTEYGSYQDIDISELSHTSGWALVQVNCANMAGRYASLRFPGDTVDDYKAVQYGGWKWQKISINHLFEAKIQDDNVKFYIIGWAKETTYTTIAIDGTVKVGATPIQGAEVFCYNFTRRTFVSRVQTDEDGEYTFLEAGYEHEDFLIACHYVDPLGRRYGGCKLIKADV